jgi:DNA-binding transcriptional ArsR family regulator
MPREQKFDLIFKALADSRRREILDLLKKKPATTGDLCAHFPELDRCTVMQHLGVLEKADLLIIRREGRLRWNYMNPLPLKEISDRWIHPHAHGAVGMLAKLKKDLEE